MPDSLGYTNLRLAAARAYGVLIDRKIDSIVCAEPNTIVLNGHSTQVPESIFHLTNLGLQYLVALQQERQFLGRQRHERN